MFASDMILMFIWFANLNKTKKKNSDVWGLSWFMVNIMLLLLDLCVCVCVCVCLHACVHACQLENTIIWIQMYVASGMILEFVSFAV